ncbi:MAG: hypothetical protein LBH42_08840 [Treponema sp.]|jgi:hypothetical protein|nr:hypothetical protein [Treponema sp.]
MEKVNVFKVFLIVLVLCVIAVSGCKTDSDASGQLVITVNNIPSEFNNGYGYVSLVIGLTDTEPVAYSLKEQISGGKVSMRLLDYNDSNAFGTSGFYWILFGISDASENPDRGFRVNKALEGGLTTISFNEFGPGVTSVISL